MGRPANNGSLSVIERTEVPEGATVPPEVWQMKRKRDIRTISIKNYRERLNIDGYRIRHGKHYENTYTPFPG